MSVSWVLLCKVCVYFHFLAGLPHMYYTNYTLFIVKHVSPLRDKTGPDCADSNPHLHEIRFEFDGGYHAAESRIILPF